MFRVEHDLLVAPVTALLFHDNWLLAGEGPVMHIYNKGTLQHICEDQIFTAENIKGIKIWSVNAESTVLVAVHGGKTCSIVELRQYTPWVRHTLFTHEFPDWILDVAWIQEESGATSVAVALAHNCVCRWDWEKDCIISKSECAEQCILYSATLLGSSWPHLVVAGGTVFNQVVLWAVKGPVDSVNRRRVLHRLHGHQGVIFSVTYNSTTGQLCSVSDDRSIRLWKVSTTDVSKNAESHTSWETASFHLLHVLYGHTARVWDARFLGDYLVSVGEDATCCVWSEAGQIIRKFKGHWGKSIWSLAVDPTSRTIATGGGDTSVRVWKLDVESAHRSCISSILQPPEHLTRGHQFVPKVVQLWQSKYVLVMADSGRLYCCDILKQEWRVLMEDQAYSSYSVLTTSPDGAVIAIGNISGHLKLIGEGWEEEQICYHGKVFSIVWLDVHSLLTTGPAGHMILWNIIERNKCKYLKASQRLDLPVAKQRWAAAAAVLPDYNLLVCGDRTGSVHLFDLNSQVHGKAGVTDVHYHGGDVYTAGRDGQYRQYTLDGSTLHLLHGTKALKGLEWLARMMFAPNDLYVLGFHTNHFIVYSVETNEKLISIPCGGGHRAWDFNLVNSHAIFVYVKGRQVALCQAELASEQGIAKPSLHGREVSAVCYLCLHHTPTGPVAVCATGSEDTRVNIVAVQSSHQVAPLKSRLQVLTTIQGHISSVRALAMANSSSEPDLLLFSGGGRAELMCWRITTSSQEVTDAPVLKPTGELLVTEGVNKYSDPSTSVPHIREVDGGNMSGSCISTTSHPQGALTAAKGTLGVNCQYTYLASHRLHYKGKRARKPWRQMTYDPSPETRYMDLTAFRVDKEFDGKCHFVGAACSDGYVRLFSFDEEEKSFDLLWECCYHGHCVLMVTHLILDGRFLVISAATDGQVAFWDLSDIVRHHVQVLDPAGGEETRKETRTVNDVTEASHVIKAHQSGVNALHLRKLHDGQVALATGGDDNSLTVHLLQMTLTEDKVKITSVRCCRHETAHAAQVNGVNWLDDDTILSASIDQRLVVWEVIYHPELQLKQTSGTLLAVSDVAQMACWRLCEDKFQVVVCGVGLQFLTLTKS